MSGMVVRSVELECNLHLSLALHYKAEPECCKSLVCNCPCGNDAKGQQARPGRAKAMQRLADVVSQQSVRFVGQVMATSHCWFDVYTDHHLLPQAECYMILHTRAGCLMPSFNAHIVSRLLLLRGNKHVCNTLVVQLLA